MGILSGSLACADCGCVSGLRDVSMSGCEQLRGFNVLAMRLVTFRDKLGLPLAGILRAISYACPAISV